MYIPLYAEYVQRTDSFRALKKMVDAGDSVLLLGFDGIDYHQRAAEANIRPEHALMDLLRVGAPEFGEMFGDGAKSVPFGHELILCGLLNETLVWEKWHTLKDRWWHTWDDAPETLPLRAEVVTERRTGKRKNPPKMRHEPSKAPRKQGTRDIRDYFG